MPSCNFFPLQFSIIHLVRFPLGHILFLELQKRVGVSLHLIPAYGVEMGSASLEARELLGEEGYMKKIKTLLGKRRGEGSLGRQPAMFTT